MKMFMWTALVVMIAFGGLVGCDEDREVEPAGNEPVKVAEPVAKAPEPVKVVEPLAAKKVLVQMETSLGDIVLELDAERAPVTVENFLGYVSDGYYSGTIFHRVIRGFMIQGGGFTENMGKKPTEAPIVNESSNGLGNDRGTIAMARMNNPNSATSQFFINHKNNINLNYGGPNGVGYAVFGKVVRGMEVVDKIAGVQTTVRNGMRDVPAEVVVINNVKVVTE